MTYLKTLITATAVCITQLAVAFDGSASITSGSLTRTFIFHSPGTSAPTSNLPLMIMMHGDGGTGAGVKSYTGMDAIADAQNFIVVYPDAVNSTWNRYADNVAGDAGLGDPNAPDDVLFISNMIDYFCSTYHINSKKVYASGHSAGGFMAYNLGVQLPNKIAAIAPVSASLWGDNTYINNYFANAYTPIPVYHIHGDADNTVDYPDPNNVADAWGEWPLSGFGNANCGHDTYISTTQIVTGANKITFCATGKEVTLIQIIGGGHGWPNVNGYNPALAIWNFCNTYSISTAANCAISTDINNLKEHENSISIFPNPTEGIFKISGNVLIKTLHVFDIAGKEINITKINEFTYSLNNVTTGINYVKIIDNKEIQSIKKLIIK